MSGILWLALDGVGHPHDAPPDSVWDQELPTLRPLIEAGWALDATLGVPGLPQSGTGQSCWLTGQNAVAVMGEHFGPVPGPKLQALLREHSLPRQLAEAGAHIALVNRYAPAYLAAEGRGGRNRLGCFPYAFREAGWSLNSPDSPALSASLGLTYEFPWQVAEPEAAVTSLGSALARALHDFDLLVADLWVSDLLGHQGGDPTLPQVLTAGRAYLRRIDLLLEAALLAGARVILSSDHGNLEDLKVKSHTLARVPLAIAGLMRPTTINNIVEGGQWVSWWVGAKTTLPTLHQAP